MRFILCFMISLILMVSLSFAEQTTYEMALKAYAKKDFTEAVKLMKEYVLESPSAKAYYLLGYASYKLDNDKEAASYFNEAYLLDPEFNPQSLIGEISLIEKRQKKAQ
ncbi:MAG: tetratricopeptide repeat protein [Nitrospirae bacterium]|nr:tetratricopeptide repeat protein [Nitrospirota bacterium]